MNHIKFRKIFEKKGFFIFSLFFLFILPSVSYGLGFEIAVGGWNQSPQGDIAYKKSTITDSVDIEKDLKYEDEFRFSGRIKLDMPLLIPNIYAVISPMEFEGKGQKDVSFKFGNKTFNANIPFNSKITVNNYDVALYYGLPFISIATAKKLNIDVGLNVRIMDLSAALNQETLSISEKQDYMLPVPMVFVAAQFEPLENFFLESEARGISYRDDHLYSVIGRVKVKMKGFFIAGGYRYDKIRFNEKDLDIDTNFKGPFVEAGIQF